MSFRGLSIGVSAVFANQRALDVTGHNISNVNTAGYTRQ
ncbi:MAG TPA: flagellar basal body protein, partial [Bacillota bacterium]|nr:flagellar basal body protein [Bacillota bacterium]